MKGLGIELPDTVIAQLAKAARANGRTVEEEAHAIVTAHFAGRSPMSDLVDAELVRLRNNRTGGPREVLTYFVLPMVAGASLMAAGIVISVMVILSVAS